MPFLEHILQGTPLEIIKNKMTAVTMENTGSPFSMIKLWPTLDYEQLIINELSDNEY